MEENVALGVEPSFAVALPCAGASIHGVAVLLPAADYARLSRQEGSYDEAEVSIERYDGRVVRGFLYTKRDPSKLAPRDIACSKRYLGVLVRGTRDAGLDKDYVAELAAKETYFPSAETLARRVSWRRPRPSNLPKLASAEVREERRGRVDRMSDSNALYEVRSTRPQDHPARTHTPPQLTPRDTRSRVTYSDRRRALPAPESMPSTTVAELARAWADAPRGGYDPAIATHA